MKNNFKLLFILPFLFVFTGCGNNKPDPVEPQLLEIEGYSMSNLTVDYDGETHSILLNEDLEDGFSCVYSNNEKTLPGNYNVTATLSKEGYSDKTLTAVLTINPLTFSDSITLSGDELDYDGVLHSLTVAGDLPENTTVTYKYNGVTANGVTDANEYVVSATLTNPVYQSKTLTANLVINKLDFTQTYTLSGATIEYDGKYHKLQLVGDIPNGATIEYKYNDTVCEDGVMDIDTYTVSATVKKKNYNDKVITSTLKIYGVEKELFSTMFGNKVFFQNDLDKDKLYCYDNGTLTKISNDIPSHIIRSGNYIYYVSNALFGGGVKRVDSSGNTKKLSGIVTDMFTTDGTYIYYNYKNIFNSEENGIYKIAISTDSLVEGTRISTSNASDMTYFNGYVYYIDASNKHLIRMSSAGGETVIDQNGKSSDLYATTNKLFYINDYNLNKTIKCVNTSNTVSTFSISAGKYLNYNNGYLYYINVDFLTSTLFGKGIYRINDNGGTNLVGQKVMELTGNSISCLNVDSNYFYYYKLHNKHLYRLNRSTNVETDLMQDFVPPLDPISSTAYSCVTIYDGSIYYTNLKDNGCLYKYDPTTEQSTKLIDDPTSNVYFYNGYMYYSTYFITNYALFKRDVETGETTKINTGKCDNLIFIEDKIYYIDVSAIGNRVKAMNLDGTNVKHLGNDKNVFNKDMAIYEGKIYYIQDPLIGNNTLWVYDIQAETIQEYNPSNNNDKDIEGMIVGDSLIYYYSKNGNFFGTYNLTSGNVNKIKQNVTVNAMIKDGNTIYYSTSEGIYKYDINSTTNTKIHDKPGSGLYVDNNKLYFVESLMGIGTLDCASQDTSYSGSLCCYDGTEVKVIVR